MIISMKLVKIVIPFLLSLIFLIVVLVALPVTAKPEAGVSEFITEYPVPGAPNNIVVAAPNQVWFTLPLSNAIGLLVVTSTVDFDVSIYPALTSASQPYDLVFDRANNAIWFTELAGGKLGRFDITTKTMTETAVISTTPTISPTGIALAPNGDVWFAMRDGNRIGRFVPETSAFTEYVNAGETGQGAYENIAAANDDEIWVTAPGVNKVVQFKPSTTSFSFYLVNELNGSTWPPGGMVVDTDGAAHVWITAPTEGRIGILVPGTLSLWNWYDLPTVGGEPNSIAHTSSNGVDYLWFTETSAGRVGQMAVATGDLLFTRQHVLLTANSQPLDIAVDATGTAWITESGANQIAQWSAPYFHFTYLPVVVNQ